SHEVLQFVTSKHQDTRTRIHQRQRAALGQSCTLTQFGGDHNPPLVSHYNRISTTHVNRLPPSYRMDAVFKNRSRTELFRQELACRVNCHGFSTNTSGHVPDCSYAVDHTRGRIDFAPHTAGQRCAGQQLLPSVECGTTRTDCVCLANAPTTPVPGRIR